VSRLARNTVIFSVATGLSRIAGLVREIVASSYFATSGAFSAFTIAFQVPNLVRSLFADAALSAAFVPVFSELLVKGNRRDAVKLASTLFFLILGVLSVICVVFITGAHVIMPLFTGDEFSAHLDALTAGLAQVMFPIVVLLGLNGLLVGILNAYDHFTIPAISPLVWNVVILVFLVGTKPFFHGDNELYAYALGIVAGTVVQLSMALPVLRRLGFHLQWSFDWRDERVKQVLRLMLPVTIGLGIINFNLLINSSLGSLISDEAPRAIDAAFRIYMLPQGIFSVAIATVLFPALSRLAAQADLAGLRDRLAQGLRLVSLLLIPAAAATLVLATPITRLIYQHGEFGPSSTALVSEALFWFSFSLPFNGLNLLLTRTFFSLQKPWLPTAISVAGLAVNVAVSVALYGPMGIGGVVLGTAASTAATTALLWRYASRELDGIDGRTTAVAALGIVTASAILGAVTYIVWALLDHLLGRSVPAQMISVGGGLSSGAVVYTRAVLWLEIAEAHQMANMVVRRVPALAGPLGLR
jgi:putative peptidoglycan lipid II flippase